MSKRNFCLSLVLIVLLVAPVFAQRGGEREGRSESRAPVTQPVSTSADEQTAAQPQAAVAVQDDPQIKQGVDLLAAKKPVEAETTLRAAVAAQPDNPKAHLYLGAALFQNGKYAESEQELAKAEPLATTGTPEEKEVYYHNRGAALARLEKWDPAVSNLEKAIELDPKEPYNHYYIGVAYHKLKRPDLMVKHLQMFLRLAPSAPEAPRCKALLKAVGA